MMQSAVLLQLILLVVNFVFPSSAECVFNSLPELEIAVSAYLGGWSVFNGLCIDDIGDWDIMNVTDLSNLFWGLSTFNEDISQWDTSSVTSLNSTFFNATSFNSDISQWDTSSVTSLEGTFIEATSFNSDISQWDTSSVTILYLTFAGATSFNSDISQWDTSNVEDLMFTFYNAAAFSRDISRWNVAQVSSFQTPFSIVNSLDFCTKRSIYSSWSDQGINWAISYRPWALLCSCT